MPIQPHLVPLVKGAFDPRRGIILRTYYVRPDKLAEMIERARAVPIKSYIHEIPNYRELAKAFTINDVSGLRNLFPKESSSWALVKTRTQDTSPHRQRGRLAQSVYAMTLRPDVLVVQAARKFLKDAAKSYELVTIDNQKPVKDGDGARVKYVTVLQKKDDPVQAALELSRLLCLINMRPRKLLDIILALVTKGTFKDKANIIPNLILPIHVYKDTPNIWTDVLTTWFTYWATDENYVLGKDALLQILVVLRRLNRKRFENLLDTYEIPSSIQHALSLIDLGFEAIINSQRLTEMQKAIILNLSTKQKDIPLLYAYVGNNQVSLDVKAAVANLVPTDMAVRLWEDYFKEAPVIDEFIASCLHGASPTAAMIMAELKAARKQGWHFLPYSMVRYVEGHPLICQLPTRLLRYVELEKFDMLSYDTRDITVHLDIAEIDVVQYVHFQPVMAFKLEEGGLLLKQAKILKQQDDCVVVLHPILSVANP